MNDYFKSRVRVTESGCWEWALSRYPAGYGQANLRRLNPTPTGAHRVSYEMHVGPIPPDMTVDHLCFNPPCVNPEHLRLLTRSENASHQLDSYKTHCIRGHEFTSENTRIKDQGNGKRECKTCHRDREKIARRLRTAHIVRTGPTRGEKHHAARLTVDDIREIRALRAAGETISAIARTWGVSRAAIQDVVHNRTWTHVTEVGA